MSRIEDDVKDFLKRVLWTVSLGFLWLVLTLAIGTYFGLLVPEEKITIANIIFYIWMAASLVVLIRVNIRIWKNKMS